MSRPEAGRVDQGLNLKAGLRLVVLTQQNLKATVHDQALALQRADLLVDLSETCAQRVRIGRSHNCVEVHLICSWDSGEHHTGLGFLLWLSHLLRSGQQRGIVQQALKQIQDVLGVGTLFDGRLHS